MKYKVKHLSNKGTIAISTPKDQLEDFDKAIDWLLNTGYASKADAIRTATILYAQDCGMQKDGIS